MTSRSCLQKYIFDSFAKKTRRVSQLLNINALLERSIQKRHIKSLLTLQRRFHRFLVEKLRLEILLVPHFLPESARSKKYYANMLFARKVVSKFCIFCGVSSKYSQCRVYLNKWPTHPVQCVPKWSLDLGQQAVLYIMEYNCDHLPRWLVDTDTCGLGGKSLIRFSAPPARLKVL